MEINPVKISSNFLLKIFLEQELFRIRTYLKLGRLRGREKKQSRSSHAEDTEFYITKSLEVREKLVFGPWMGELGFEVLYWSPLVNHFARKGDFALSRGGISLLYPKLTYVEILDCIDKFRWDETQKKRKLILGGEKQRKWLASEFLLLKKLLRGREHLKFRIFHPSNLFNLYSFNSKIESTFQKKLLKEFCKDISCLKVEYEKIVKIDSQKCLIATYSREGLSNDDIKEFLKSEKLSNLVENYEVVNLKDLNHDLSHQFVTLEEKVSKSSFQFGNNLERKIIEILESRIVITTDGGLAYLSLLLGRDTYALRGFRNYWSEYHSEMADYLSKINGCKYQIIQV